MTLMKTQIGAWAVDNDSGHRAIWRNCPTGRWIDGRCHEVSPPPALIHGLLLYVAVMAGTIGSGRLAIRATSDREARTDCDDRRAAGSARATSRPEWKSRARTKSPHWPTSFNTSAERIERLVDSNRQLLAHASHELRTPLARVRLGVEMLKEKEDPKRRAALER